MEKHGEHRSTFHYQEIHLQHSVIRRNSSNITAESQAHATGTSHADLLCHAIKARSREKITILTITLTQLQQN